MQGRKFMISATWNAPRETFDNPGSFLYCGKGTADLFLAITSNYKITGFDVLTDYGVFDFFKNPDIPRAIQDYGTQGETSHPLPSSRADCRMPAGKPWMVSSVQKQTGATKEPPRAET